MPTVKLAVLPAEGSMVCRALREPRRKKMMRVASFIVVARRLAWQFVGGRLFGVGLGLGLSWGLALEWTIGWKFGEGCRILIYIYI